jgi:Uracil DNA glycosylase superfamily
MSTFADRVISFNKNLHFKGRLPSGIKVMNPFKENPGILPVVEKFYKCFYNDNQKRHLIVGINPGRFGAGSTGIPFSDTKRLSEFCDIQVEDMKTHELSSVFVYEVIKAYGGVKKFYSDFYITSVCPLGFTRVTENDKAVNYNYYDTKQLQAAVHNFIIENLYKQIEIGVSTDICFVMGMGMNAKYLLKLNAEKKFFKKIVPLEHPRYIMQYRLKKLNEYVKKYIRNLRTVDL